MIYFDNSATTQIHPEVVDKIKKFIEEEYGNPSSKYYVIAQKARQAVERAREKVAKLFNCSPDEVIFTSGATESNNFILKGLADLCWEQPKYLVTTVAEHPSILETAKYLERRGYPVKFISVDHNGRANLKELESFLYEHSQDTFLVSIVWGNNELGTLNDIEQIAEICSQFNVLLHSDATQVVGKYPIDLQKVKVHFLSASGHKIHGPKGIGVCIIRKDEAGIRRSITPILHGGGQEFGLRSGTLPVHNIVGMGAAAEIALRDLNEVSYHLQKLEDYCKKRLLETFPEIIEINARETKKIPGILSVQFKGINNEILIKKLSDHVALSTGSACSSDQPSHVLQEIGLNLDQVRYTVRISFSRFNTIEQIDEFISLLSG